jgi:hypothetical protein
MFEPIVQCADHPDFVTEASDDHSISINPVFDETELGILDPENTPNVSHW